jgi:hypothetical protein
MGQARPDGVSVVNRTLLIAAAALVLPASAALAQAVPAGAGALSGRSPQASYRVANVASAVCGKTLHTQPAGKLPVYGTHALPKAPCPSVELARVDSSSDTARD